MPPKGKEEVKCTYGERSGKGVKCGGEQSGRDVKCGGERSGRGSETHRSANLL